MCIAVFFITSTFLPSSLSLFLQSFQNYDFRSKEHRVFIKFFEMFFKNILSQTSSSKPSLIVTVTLIGYSHVSILSDFSYHNALLNKVVPKNPSPTFNIIITANFNIFTFRPLFICQIRTVTCPVVVGFIINLLVLVFRSDYRVYQ